MWLWRNRDGLACLGDFAQGFLSGGHLSPDGCRLLVGIVQCKGIEDDLVFELLDIKDLLKHVPQLVFALDEICTSLIGTTKPAP